MEALAAAVIAESWNEASFQIQQLRVCQEAAGSHFVSPIFVSRVQQGFGLVRIQSAALESSLNCWLDLVSWICRAIWMVHHDGSAAHELSVARLYANAPVFNDPL